MALEIGVPGCSDGAKLSHAILVYTRDNSRYYSAQSNDPLYASIHPVRLEKSDGGSYTPVIGAGEPLSVKALSDMGAMVNGQGSVEESGVLPENLLFQGAGVMAFWIPAGKRHTFYRTQYEGIGNTSALIPHPAVVMVVTGRNWYVAALPHNKRPMGGDLVCHAPYMNVDGRGRICTGNVVLPEANIASRIKQWQSAFFDSNFTHPNYQHAVKGKAGLVGLTRELIAGKWKRFPTSRLNPMNVSLGQFIHRIAGGDSQGGNHD